MISRSGISSSIVIRNWVRVLAFLFGITSIVAGCSGDPRPLQEAVEATELDLAQLFIESEELGAIVPGADTPVARLNHGETIQFSLRALNSQGTEITVPNTDRLWFVSNGQRASISGSGFLTALSDGSVFVGIQIGGVAAQSILVEVSDAVLTGISEINGPDTLIECQRSTEYTATGTYDDGFDRDLRDIEWSLAVGSEGKLLDSSPTEAIVGGLAPGVLTLVATSGTLTGTREITVAQGLSELEILPALIEVEINATVPLAAQAVYDDETTDSVTDLVTWSIDENLASATVSNESGSEGLLRGGESVAQTQVIATCGDQFTAQGVSVVATGEINRLEISPTDDPIEIRVRATEQLTVTAISDAGSRVDATNLATYEVTSGTDNISVDSTGSVRGEVTGVASGSSTIRITYGGATESVRILVP